MVVCELMLVSFANAKYLKNGATLSTWEYLFPEKYCINFVTVNPNGPLAIAEKNSAHNSAPLRCFLAQFELVPNHSRKFLLTNRAIGWICLAPEPSTNCKLFWKVWNSRFLALFQENIFVYVSNSENLCWRTAFSKNSQMLGNDLFNQRYLDMKSIPADKKKLQVTINYD